jgi:hypothetical protein
MWYRFPETKWRTLEDIGTMFRDENVSSQWYGPSEEYKAKIRDEAMTKGTGDDKFDAIRMEEVVLWDAARLRHEIYAQFPQYCNYLA